MTLTGITLTSSTGTDVSLLPAAVELEWISRSLAPTLLGSTQVPAGTYTQVEVLVASPQMVVFNPVTRLFETFTPTLSVSAVQIPLSLTLSGGEVVGFRLDFDLLNSVVSNTDVDPQFALVQTSFQSGQLPGDIDDALGTVNSIDLLNNRFTMTLVTTSRQITLDVDSATVFDGVVSDISGLSVGQRVEVDARLETTGRFRALVVEVDKTTSTNFLRGLVIGRTPASGDATSLDVLVLEENPDQSGVDAGDQRIFSIDAATSFRINQEDLSVLGLSFSRQEVSPGQIVLIEPDSAQPARATQVILKQGTVPGTVNIIGLTTFDFTPLSGFFPDVGFPSIRAVTAPQSEFEDLPLGMSDLRVGQTVGSRGLLLFEFGQPRLITKRVRLLQ